MATSPTHAKHLCVAVIADSRETLDGLQAYLQGAGITSHATRTLQGATAVPPAATAVVLFPDELDAKAVVTQVSALRAARPRLLVLVVTSHPQRLRAALDTDGRAHPPIVLPKPAFGWTILDAIRDHAGSESR
jgi:hypothetical protein